MRGCPARADRRGCCPGRRPWSACGSGASPGALAVLGGAVLTLVTILAVVSIIGRYASRTRWPVFDGLGPIPGDFELVSMGAGFAVFSFLAWCQFNRGHVTVDIFVSWMGPRALAALSTFTNLVLTAVVVLIAWQHGLGLHDKMRFRETTTILQIPVWWGYAGGARRAVELRAGERLYRLAQPQRGAGRRRARRGRHMSGLVIAGLFFRAAALPHFRAHADRAGDAGLRIGGLLYDLRALGAGLRPAQASCLRDLFQLFALGGAAVSPDGGLRHEGRALGSPVFALPLPGSGTGAAASPWRGWEPRPVSVRSAAPRSPPPPRWGRVALPELRKHGYSGALATGSLAAGGTLGILIPPSIILVIYAILTEQNIAKLFVAAMIPGLLAALGYMITVAITVRLNPDDAMRTPRLSLMARLKALGEIWPVVAIFVVMIGGMKHGGVHPHRGRGFRRGGDGAGCGLARETRFCRAGRLFPFHGGPPPG